MMDKLREALEAIVETVEWAPKNGHYMDAWRMCVDAAKAALAAPVAGDALELARAIGEDCFYPWRFDKEAKQYRGAFDFEDAVALIDAALAERERKAREEEREACAKRAVAWLKALCKADGWTCKTCTECDQLRAAIKEAMG